MEHRFRWVAVFAVVLVGIVVGTVAYNAGMSHGLAVSVPAAVAQGAPGAPGAPIYYRYHPWGFGFGFFPLGILLFWFLFARLLFWGGGRRWHRYGPYYPGPYDPPSFDEWHRRAHERMNNQPKE